MLILLGKMKDGFLDSFYDDGREKNDGGIHEYNKHGEASRCVSVEVPVRVHISALPFEVD